MEKQGTVRKMQTKLENPVQYALPLGDELIPVNSLLGQKIELMFKGEIQCLHCGRKTSKSFSQGYCYPCFQQLAQCDICIVKPEQCHYDQGTCREPEWGVAHCMQAHIVYLANSSGVKVGITRQTQVPTRWIDQGAVQALAIMRTKSRYIAGLVEVLLKEHVSDRTSWQKMLKGNNAPIDLLAKCDQLIEICKEGIAGIQGKFGQDAVEMLREDKVQEISYPVHEYPVKVKSFNLDKVPEASGRLMGVKGQYLIFDTGVINIRKYGGYGIAVRA